jgi:hypothetical protein
MITCLMAGMDKAPLQAVKYKKPINKRGYMAKTQSSSSLVFQRQWPNRALLHLIPVRKAYLHLHFSS